MATRYVERPDNKRPRQRSADTNISADMRQHNWNCLRRFRGIPWNHTLNVHRGSIYFDYVTLKLHNMTLTSHTETMPTQ